MKPGDDDGLNQLLSTFRYFARAHHAMACLRTGCSYSYLAALRVID